MQTQVLLLMPTLLVWCPLVLVLLLLLLLLLGSTLYRGFLLVGVTLLLHVTTVTVQAQALVLTLVVPSAIVTSLVVPTLR
jgi:hypothetical protein